MRKAVIDVGSNSVLLLVAEKTADGWHPVLETTEVTALGEGTKTSGVLSERGMSDTLAAVKRAYEAAKGAGSKTTIAAVTMAARIASNTPEFQSRAVAQGTPIQVLSGEEEARLGFLAVADDPIFSCYQRLSIIDVGGHSTELATAEREADSWKTLFRRSFPVGTLGLRSTVLQGERLDGLDLIRGSKEIDEVLGLQYLPHSAGAAVALGATGTNLITIRERMTEWDPERVHGQYLDYEEISRSVGWMSPMSDEERAAIPGMEKGREKTIHIGSLILERFLNSIHVLGCSVSVRGWRHALLEDGI